MNHVSASRTVCFSRCKSISRWVVGLVVVWFTGLASLHGADWPAYRHDNARSGITAEQLTYPLTERWVYQAAHSPRPAWGDPKPIPLEDILELRRVHFDDVFQVVSASGRVYFGSSADHHVYCLDLEKGTICWSYLTGGPIRLAPTLAAGKLYVASDDGHAYCLNAADGTLVWQLRGVPEDRCVLGQGKMISLWPSRTGVLVDQDIAYFAMGVFPTEGVFLYAVDASTGRVIWKNDTTGEKPQSRISPQGYLMASATRLYAPMGRVSPAAFDRKNGNLVYETSFGKQVGGSYALLAGDDVYTGTEEIIAFHQATRDQFATFPGRRILVTEKTFYVATNTELMAMDRANKKTAWRVRCHAADELILAGDTLVAAGGNQVTAVSAADGKTRWQTAVDGAAKGLAVADGHLLISTDKGWIYCFGPESQTDHGVVRQPVDPGPFGDARLGRFMAAAADTILQESSVRRGYCLIAGCETGQLAAELARRSELTIYAVTADAKRAAAIRKTLDATGLLGSRVCVECWPLDHIPYSDYFANLVVSETGLITGKCPVDPKALLRFVKPLGGALMIGTPAGPFDGGRAAADRESAMLLWAPDFAGAKRIDRNGRWFKFIRPRLPDSGNWTQQYADPGNTACGADARVKAPLDLLWFGRPGPGKMVNRHQRAAAPVAYEGRMFIEGENVLMCYDIYNGVKIWERDLPGAMRANASHDGGNLAVSDKGLFVAIADSCYRLELDTGEILAKYKAPVEGRYNRWGYIALVGTDLYGTRAAGAGGSSAVFCFDVESGVQKWIYAGGMILHNAISIGDGQVMLVRSDVTAPQRAAALKQAGKDPGSADGKQALVRLVVALDAATGKPRWQHALDLTHCGNLVASMYNRGVLVLFGVFLDGHYWKEFFAGQFEDRTVTALSGSDGKQLWSRAIGYRVRPLIVDGTLHAEPWAFDLQTGERKTRINPITGVEEPWQFARPGHHCGCPSAATNLLLFRSWNLGFYDLLEDYGTTHFAGQRPGCWISFIPAGGLVLMPEASTGCMCDFPNQGSVVFAPSTQQRAWAWYSSYGPVTPVKGLAMNLAAPGDRRDPSGILWLGYPRPGGSLVLEHQIDASFYGGGRFRQHNSTYSEVVNTDAPWLYASEAAGLRKLVVPILDSGDGKARYTVRLLFADTENQEPGARVFDIKLQGQVVAKDFDIIARAGKPGSATVLEVPHVEVDEELTIELLTRNPRTTLQHLPLLSGLEIKREQFTVPGCIVPSVLVNNRTPEKQVSIALANLCAEPFEGSLRITAPEGIRVVPTGTPVQIATGARTQIPVTVVATQDLAAGAYTAKIELVRTDGRVVLERTMAIEHLGPLARIVLDAVEDAHIAKRYPDRNQGASSVMLVDGGLAKMNDDGHSVALIKFRLDIPGKPVVAKFRIVDASNPSGDAGAVRLVTGAWSESSVTYNSRPDLGPVLARLGRVEAREVVTRVLDIDLTGKKELSVAIDPTSADGLDFLTREGGGAPQLIIDYIDKP